MPLIALDILKNKIQELLLIISGLKEENRILKSRAGESSGKELPAEALYELEKLREETAKYKKQKNAIYSRVSEAIKEIDELIEKEGK